MQKKILQFTEYTVPDKFAGLLSGIASKIKVILGKRINPELEQVLNNKISKASPNPADLSVLKQLTMFVSLLSKTPGSILLNLKTKALVGGGESTTKPSFIVETTTASDDINVTVESLETTLSEYFMFLAFFVGMTVTGVIPVAIVGAAMLSPLLLFNLFVYLFPETAKFFNLTYFEMENNHNGGTRRKRNFGRKTIYKTHIS